jgi:hypothetical protein
VWCGSSFLGAADPVIKPFVRKPLRNDAGKQIIFLMINIAILSLLTLATLDPSIEVGDIDKHRLKPFAVEGKATILFFLSTECPISRFYATEIQAICRRFAIGGAHCRLVYEDLPLTGSAVREHLKEFGYQGIPAIVDGSGDIARLTGASVTPEAVVIDRGSTIRYRGRIDNFYADLGKGRRQATIHDLTDALEAVLAGRDVLNPETAAVGCYIVPPEPPKTKETK